MKWSNLVHNILNVLIAAAGGVTAYLIATGCTDVGGALDCSASSISPELTATITALLGITKTVLNVVRDGLAGLYKEQPKIEP
ncbi:MAG: hypothetical protein AB7Q00_15015 [Phycisphaerales bacterium]